MSIYSPNGFVIVSQTVSRRWVVPEGKSPEEFLAEVLEFGFDEEPAHEEVLSEEYYFMDKDGDTSELSPSDDEED